MLGKHQPIEQETEITNKKTTIHKLIISGE